MEEKERYKLESHNGTFCEFHDTETDEWYIRKDLVTDLLNQQDKRIKELEQEIAKLQQKAIMPKFKIGQEVWWIDTRVNSFNEQRYRIESYLIDSIVITKEQFRYYGDDGLWLGDNGLFATKEEAEQKLAKIGGKNE